MLNNWWIYYLTLICALVLISCKTQPIQQTGLSKESYIDTIVTAYPLDCTNDALHWRRVHDQHVYAQNILALLGSMQKMGTTWKTGNRHYDNAYKKLIDSVADNSQNFGSFPYKNFESYLRDTLNEGSLEELSDFATFIKTENGQLFWDAIFEGNICHSTYQYVTQKRRLPRDILQQVEKKQLEVGKKIYQAQKRIKDLSFWESDSIKDYSSLYVEIKKRFDSKQIPSKTHIKEFYNNSFALIEPELESYKKDNKGCCKDGKKPIILNVK